MNAWPRVLDASAIVISVHSFGTALPMPMPMLMSWRLASLVIPWASTHSPSMYVRMSAGASGRASAVIGTTAPASSVTFHAAMIPAQKA